MQKTTAKNYTNLADSNIRDIAWIPLTRNIWKNKN